MHRSARTSSIGLLTALVVGACDREPEPAHQPAPVAPRIAPPPPRPPPPIAPPAPAPVRPAPWVEFGSATWDFRAEFPEPPITEVIKVPTPVGELDMHLFAVDRGAWAYLVTVLERQAGPAVAPGLLLDGARNGAVTNVGGRLVRETELTREGLPARRLEIVAGEGEQQQRVEVLLILRGRRLYQAVIAAPASEAIAPEAERFFAALHVTP
jgi:hypothetical protein